MRSNMKRSLIVYGDRGILEALKGALEEKWEVRLVGGAREAELNARLECEVRRELRQISENQQGHQEKWRAA